MKKIKWIAVILAGSMLTACTEPNGAPGRGVEHGGAVSKTDIGTVAGVIGGGVLGSAIGGGVGNTAAIIGGGLLGGFLGNQLGQSLDNADQAAYESASQRAMESGQTKTWRNGSHHGTIVPHKRYRNDAGQYCREYNQTIYVDGKRQSAHGTACRESDGSWKIAD